jgi:hypothetical protein
VRCTLAGWQPSACCTGAYALQNAVTAAARCIARSKSGNPLTLIFGGRASPTVMHRRFSRPLAPRAGGISNDLISNDLISKKGHFGGDVAAWSPCHSLRHATSTLHLCKRLQDFPLCVKSSWTTLPSISAPLECSPAGSSPNTSVSRKAAVLCLANCHQCSPANVQP